MKRRYPVKLYPISTAGIRAFCSALIVDPEEPETVYFMSICGYQTTVKGILANLLESYGIRIDIDGTVYQLERSDLSYKVQVKKLPSGLVHAIVFPELALPKHHKDRPNSFFIFTGKTEERIALFFRHLTEKTEIPLHPAWANWLWKQFREQQDWLLDLKTLAGGLQGYLVSFNPNHLYELVSDAIKDREPEIIKCFEWKGGKNNGEPDNAKRISG